MVKACLRDRLAQGRGSRLGWLPGRPPVHLLGYPPADLQDQTVVAAGCQPHPLRGPGAVMSSHHP